MIFGQMIQCNTLVTTVHYNTLRVWGTIDDTKALKARSIVEMSLQTGNIARFSPIRNEILYRTRGWETITA